MFVKNFYDTFLKEKYDRINKRIPDLIQSHPIPKSIHPILLESTANGRRFRPLLMLLTNSGVGGNWREIIDLSCSIELLHKASLIHDDLVDGDSYRRGHKTLWATKGERIALIAGDVLIGIALSTVSNALANVEFSQTGKIMDIFVNTLKYAAIGEFLDLEFEGLSKVDESSIREMMRLKSGALIAASTQIGAITGGASNTLCHELTQLGWQIGVIFQIINDLNNLNGLDTNSKGSWGQDIILNKKSLVTWMLHRRSIDLNTFHLLSNNQRLQLFEPIASEINTQINIAYEHTTKLPEGILKQLFTLLLKEVNNKWYWSDETEQVNS